MTTVLEQIAALPKIPDPKLREGALGYDWERYSLERSIAFDARLALAERGIREYLDAVDAPFDEHFPFGLWKKAAKDAEANLRLILEALK